MAKYKLDITKDHCPMTFVKTKVELAKINTGDLLEITLTGGEPLENVPKSASEQGHKIIETKYLHNNTYLLVIEKG